MFKPLLNSMTKSPEDNLYQAILVEDQDTVEHLLSNGANPNKTVKHGKTCLGEAASMGKISIVKLLIEASKTCNIRSKNPFCTRKRHSNSHKRKLKHNGQQDETVVKCKSLSERTVKDNPMNANENIGSTSGESKSERNQGYFVCIHSEGSSSDDSRISNIRSPLSPPPFTSDLEWDEDIVNVAATTSEDETWSSIYKWYAAILECTGAAIASAAGLNYGIDQQDAFMRTALHYSAEQGHAGVVKLLLDAGCKVDVTAGDGLTSLHVAVIRKHLEVVRLLIAAGSQVNYKTHEKMTPLHFAASRGFIDLVKILVSNGASIEARDTNERTALYLAAGRGHEDVVQYLISAGANVNGEEIHGYTPLCEAVWQRYADVVEILLKFGARITHSHKLLHNAVIQRQERIVKMLANIGAGMNIHNDNGDTPLLLAARLAQPVAARILLENGANVNSCNSITGANALHIAVECIDWPKDFEDVLLCLLDYSIDMNSTALTGETPLIRALLLHRDHATVSLIRHGADVNACDLHSSGFDNLSIASTRPSCSLASMLLKAGHYAVSPDPSTTPPDPGTTAHWLYETCKTPLDLTDLCRIKIRSMSKNRILFRYIESLPLPNSLKLFLMMHSEGVYVYEDLIIPINSSP